ncbi:glycoside hydrolase family 99-like domain-containing protein [Cumulibacter soli]|uniref:glycoside hydrolase family 99-like domain-containing protein n=1 Tax=Cumulibacter soli TaxID=2546344 RepID=UPI001ABB519D|nr:glycoside hydrolase family 99-like domain-containing protein [Cumulibacter soli]
MSVRRHAGKAKIELIKGAMKVRSKIAPRKRLYAILGKELPEGYGVPPEPPYERPNFNDWVDVGTAGRFTGFPDEWRMEPGVTIEDPASVAVVMHVYYVDLVDELLEQLRTIPVPFDLLITNASGTKVHVPTDIANLRNHREYPILNRGRDIWPTIALINSGVIDPYPVILKVHTKKSQWRESHEGFSNTGEQWRGSFYDDLLGTTENVSEILNGFASAPSLGVVTANESVLGPEFWGDNEWATQQLANRVQLDIDQKSLRFAAGSMYWCRGFVLQGLRALCLSEVDFEPEKGQNNATTAHAIERLIGVLTEQAALSTEERKAVPASADPSAWRRFDGREIPHRVRAVPFYLPQFHPFEENNRWWGTGFTEWLNVASAQPVYHGHYQPMVPTDLGYYDLRTSQARVDQANLAKFAGVEGFMYYYYWFAGKRLMSQPIEQMLASDLNFPFCLMWANENWTRRWDGADEHVLIAQDYEHVPAENFIDDVAEFLADDRYLTISGKKVLAVYRPAQMANFGDVVANWRSRARELGLGELKILAVDVGSRFDGLSGTNADHGLDGSLDFPPHNMTYAHIDRHPLKVHPKFRGNILGYREVVDDAIARLRGSLGHDHFPGAMVTFDNTARRQWAPDLWWGSNPYLFRRWVCALAEAVVTRPHDERVIFINAWNEWAEAAVLEPSSRYGRSYLLALRDVVLS